MRIKQLRNWRPGRWTLIWGGSGILGGVTAALAFKNRDRIKSRVRPSATDDATSAEHEVQDAVQDREGNN